jgi:hypothetical protein
MVSPAVIGGFAVIDASLLGQLVYAVRSYELHHADEDAEARARRAPVNRLPVPAHQRVH